MTIKRKRSTRLRLRRPIPIGLCILIAGVVLAHAPDEGNGVKPGMFIVEPPTLTSFGFEWYVDGDRNHNATVEVSYRKKGGDVWKNALPLLRINREESIFSFLNNRIDYVTPNMFAGSILDLEPDTEYECKFRMSDPDGVDGKGGGHSEKVVTASTRPEPKPAIGGRIYHVYPRNYAGPKKEPAFSNLMAAYYTGW